MATVTKTITMVRKSTSDLFMDWTATNAGEYHNEMQSLPINMTVTWSTDGLIRTTTRSYDDSIQPQIDALKTKYATYLTSEKTRRQTIGITSTVQLNTTE